MSTPCQHKELVADELCSVTYCADCGSVNLALGSMTLHLTAKQFEGLAKAFSKAVASKRAMEQVQAESDVLGEPPSKELH